ITTSTDGKQIYVTVSGTHELCVVDVEGMLKKLLTLPKNSQEAKEAGTYNDRGTYSTATAADVPNDLAFLVGLKKRIKLSGKGPRGLAVADGKVYVGMYFSDSIEKIEPTAIPKISTIELSPADNEMTAERKGEMYWNDATLCFQFWQSCASCHPEARVDALNWDLLNDGLGNPKNAKTMLQAHLAPPAMWEGVRKTSAIAIRTGFRYILFAVPNEQICNDIDAFLHAMQPLESPLLVNGELSDAAKKGKELFESSRLNCVECHPEPLYTDKKLHDVNSKASFDRKSSFDTPSLIEVWRTAPYMHDGRFVDMKDVFSVGKHGDVNGDIDTLTPEEIDDLVEYVLSL
ncbi:MAG: c-type cytochrome, partial [Thermoguttaceae bacterium]